MRFRIQNLILAIIFFTSFSLYADSSQGYSYLLTQQQSNGSVVSNPALVHPFQSTIETIIAFDNDTHSSGLELIQAINFIKSVNDLSAEFSSRALILGIEDNIQGELLLDRLVIYQNQDGGFGARTGYNSTVIDTALVIESLIKSEYLNEQLYQRAINYIIENQLSDGSFRIDLVNTSSVFVTAKVLASITYFMFKYSIASQVEAGRDFLLEQLATNIQLTTWERASALNAVIPITSDTSKYKDIIDLLHDQQLDNGSWENSAYTTAIVLQALYLIDNITQPIEPSVGIVKGIIVDKTSKLPLVGVNITVEPSINTVNSDSSGEFELVGVLPNDYTFSYLLDGYVPISRSIRVVAGQMVNVGEIDLLPVLDKGTISGVIVDAETLTVISGAVISITGTTNVSVISDSLGLYHFSLKPGAINISISAEGYNSISGNTEVIAGKSLKLSPSLVKEGGNPPDTSVSVKGRVLDENTGQPLNSVLIKALNSGEEVLSDSNGDFVLDDLIIGELKIEFFKPQYQSVIYKILTVDGSPVNVGNVNLKTSTALDNSSIFGDIIDSKTGAPIAGATVSIASHGLNAITDSLGQYQLHNIPVLSFELSVSGVGYIGQSSMVALPKHQRSQVNMGLISSQVNGLAITNISSEKYSYDAYQKIKINASITNTSTSIKNIDFIMIVRNSAGSIITSFPAVHSPIDGEITDSILTVNSNRTIETSFEWMNGNMSPENYQVTLIARDLNTRQTLSEKAIMVSIETDSLVSSMVVSALPRFTNVEATENIKFKVSVINKSNTSTSTSFAYRWLDSSGNVIVENISEITTLPSDVEKSLELDSISHQFLASGEYTIEVDVIEGVIPQNIVTRSIFVAPLVRVDPSIYIEPHRVLPDGDKKVKVRLKLKGSN